MLIFPPDYPNINNKIIFLAGPIQGAANWQEQATEHFRRLAPDIAIANPRRQYLDGQFDYAAQVDWESYHLQLAAKQGLIFFFLANEQQHFCDRAYAQTTRFELAEWKTKQLYNPNIKLVIAIESGFSGARYIRHRFGQDNPQTPILDGLEAGCQAAIELIEN